MAQLNWKKSLSGLFKTKVTGIDDALERYMTFKLTRKSMEQAQRMTSPSGSISPKFNNKQCKYLADKLKVAVESAQESVLLEFLKIETVDMTVFLEVFKFMYALSKEVESFIQACCKDAWIQDAVLLSNVEQHILSIGFNLELCTIFFTARADFEGVYEAEAENVRDHAASDMEALLGNLHALKLHHEGNPPSAELYQLAEFLIERLGRQTGRLALEDVRKSGPAVGNIPVLDKATLIGRPRPALEGIRTKLDLEAYPRLATQPSYTGYYNLVPRPYVFYGSVILRFDSLPGAVRTMPMLETDYGDNEAASRSYHQSRRSAPAPAAPAPAPASYDDSSLSATAPGSNDESSFFATATGSYDETSFSAAALRPSESSLSEIFFKSLIQKENLGKGSAGTVHKVMWMGADFAMKTFYGPNNPDFVKEVSILSGLSHPNIISLLCSKAEKRKCSIVMELMDADLFALMHSRLEGKDQESPFTIFGAVDIMLQIAEGMRYLHERRIVHRDLKSSNILVRRVKSQELEIDFVIAKVADFGLSRTKERSMTYSNQTPNMGTTRWMAPETIKLGDYKNQAETFTSEVEARYPYKSDVYNFSMVCYEILTGEVPFSNLGKLDDIKKMVLEGERPQLPHGCPKELKILINSCWSPNASKRPCFSQICADLRYIKFILLCRASPAYFCYYKTFY